ncbi:O-antigen ligase family protein [Erysipelothrix sp. D19-032]
MDSNKQRYYVGGENFDLENDLHGIFYSYGYVGFAMYLGFILYVLLRGIYSYFFSKEFRFNQNLAIYLVALGLIMGASQFSRTCA